MPNQNVSAYLGNYKSNVDAALAAMYAERVMERIWRHDYTLWKPDPAEISDRLGWLYIAKAMRQFCINEFTEKARVDGFTHALLLGMGGSSLAPEVFRKTFGVKDEYLDLAVLDSTDPGAVLAHARSHHLCRTLFIVSTKSGTTVETLSLFKYFYNRLANAVGISQVGSHFIAITDPGTSLVDLAKKCNFRAVFLNDATIGGRYSAFSYFGLVPAALIGVNLSSLLDRAIDMMGSCKICNRLEDNPGAYLGAVMGALAMTGRDKLTLIISPQIAHLGVWIEQLVAESTGKEGKGILPVEGERSSTPDIYGDDRLFVYLRLNGDSTYDDAVNAIRLSHPVVQINLQDLYDLGGEFFRWKMATAMAGYLLKVNPFDQPNVESAKKLAKDMVSVYEQEKALPVMIPTLRSDGIEVYANFFANTLQGAMKAFLDQAHPGDYISIQAYVRPTDQVEAALQKLRHKLRDNTGLATTVGYGPRFLHSTGQLHKGDAGNGLFIQITADDLQDVPIPKEAGAWGSSITFGVLKAAQALGDRQALLNAGRRVISLHLGSSVVGGLEHLIKFC